MEQKALLGIVLLPLFGAVFNGLFGRGSSKEWQVERGTVHGVACSAVAGSFLLALFYIFKQAKRTAILLTRYSRER